MAFFVAYLSIMCKQGVLEDKNQLGHYLDIFSPNLCIRTFKAFKCALSFLIITLFNVVFFHYEDV